MLKNTTKLITILIVFCLCLSSVALADAQTIIDETYENLDEGVAVETLDGWSLSQDGGSYNIIFGNRNTVIDTDDNTFIRVAAGTSNYWDGAHTRLIKDIPDKGEGVYEISYRVNPEVLGAYLYDCFTLYAYVINEDTSTTTKPIIYMTDAGTIGRLFPQFKKWGDGYYSSHGDNVFAISANTWYDVKYIVNTVANKATVSIKGSSDTEWKSYEDQTIAPVDGLDYLLVRPGWKSTASSMAFDDVKVVYHSLPAVTSTLPLEGADDVDNVGASVELSFSMAMDETTINEDSILVYEGESTEPLSKDAYEVSCTSDSFGNTIATVEFVNTLPYATDYTVKVLGDSVTSQEYGMNLEKDFTLKFTTKPEAYVATISVTDGDLAPVDDLTSMVGETITVDMSIKANYEASAYIAVVTIEDADGAMLMMANAQGTVDIVNGASFKPTFLVPENAKTIRAFLWKDYTTALPLAAEAVFEGE